MSYNASYLSQLKEINSLIDQKQIIVAHGALEKFKVYLNVIKNLGTYSINDWPEEWCREVYLFGEKFKENTPNLFLAEIKRELAQSNDEQKEVIEFIHSEIIYNHLPGEREKILFQLKEKYLLNAEFVHSLGWVTNQYDNYEKTVIANEYFKQAFKLNKINGKFGIDYINSEFRIVDFLLKAERFDDAKNIAKVLRADENLSTYRNNIWAMFKRIDDHILIKDKIELMSQKAEESISRERVKLIEVLGFFSAIMAVIFSTVIGQKSDFKESLKFLIVLGIILNIFLISMSYVFPKTEKLEKNFIVNSKFVVLCILIITMIFLFVIYGN